MYMYMHMCNHLHLCISQYHFVERNRTWNTHFVMVFSVYSEWERYSLAEKENMAEIMSHYRRDFDVVMYSKNRNLAAARAWYWVGSKCSIISPDPYMHSLTSVLHFPRLDLNALGVKTNGRVCVPTLPTHPTWGGSLEGT
jgi:hypothetical protein